MTHEHRVARGASATDRGPLATLSTGPGRGFTGRVQVHLASLLLLLVVIVLTGCGGSPKAAAGAPATGATAADSGIVQLSAEAVANAGLHLGSAEPATIDATVDLPGEVRFDPSRVLDVRPRFAGVVKHLAHQVGDRVARGATLATIESNESLTEYAITAALAGRVMARPVAEGQTVTPEISLFTIADLSSVWVEFAVYPNDLARIHAGAAARVALQSSTGEPERGTVSYVGPSSDPAARVSVGRVVLPNRGMRWEPGLFATVTVTVAHDHVTLSVPDAAVVRTDTGPVVFVAESPTRFRRVEVRTGRSDGVRTEILSGITGNARVVDRNAFVLRSELEKGSVEE